MASIKKLAEQALRVVSGGNVRSSSSIHQKEMEAVVVQAMSSVLKLETVALSKQFGDIPFNFVATYEGITVEEVSDCECKAKLPIHPISLPFGVGVWAVYKPDCPSDGFVPMVVGSSTLLSRTKHSGMADILGSEVIAYEPVGSEIKIKRGKDDIGETVTVQLLVSDPSKIGVDDPLPLPQDMELLVVKSAIEVFMKKFPHDDSNDGKSNV